MYITTRIDRSVCVCLYSVPSTKYQYNTSPEKQKRTQTWQHHVQEMYAGLSRNTAPLVRRTPQDMYAVHRYTYTMHHTRCEMTRHNHWSTRFEPMSKLEFDDEDEGSIRYTRRRRSNKCALGKRTCDERMKWRAWRSVWGKRSGKTDDKWIGRLGDWKTQPLEQRGFGGWMCDQLDEVMFRVIPREEPVSGMTGFCSVWWARPLSALIRVSSPWWAHLMWDILGKRRRETWGRDEGKRVRNMTEVGQRGGKVDEDVHEKEMEK